MRQKLINVFWGIVLILGGAFFLLKNNGYFTNIPDGVWKYIFIGASLLFFATWLANGIRNWGWLVPACVFGGLSITVLMGEIGNFGGATATPLLASIAIPFIFAFAVAPQQNRWALIPAWVMFVISLITLFADRVDGNYIGALVLYSIAVPFLVVYLLNRSHWWALIPAAVMFVIGTVPLMSALINPEMMGAAVMLLFAAAFLGVYFWSKINWWALIPAGVFLSISLVVILTLNKVSPEKGWNGLMTGVMLAGIGTTFGVLWLLRHNHPTFWAKYPAIGLFIAAIIAMFSGEKFNIFWPIVFIVVGLYLLLSYIFKKPSKDTLQPPQE